MLRAVCLNPVLDRTYYIDDFRVDDKFMNVAPHMFAGGKGVNNARVIAQLGEPCVLYAFLGGAAGDYIRRDIEKYGVELRAFAHEGETRSALDIMDLKNGVETEVVERGVTVGPKEEDLFLNTLADDLSPEDIVLCSGLPMYGMDADIYRRAAEVCALKGARIALDIDSTLFPACFPAHYLFNKPNIKELKNSFALESVPEPGELKQIGERARAMGIDNFMVSLGGAGSVLFYEDGAVKYTIPKVDVKCSVGSGDATVAGFCTGVARDMSIEEAGRLAMACGVSNAMHEKIGYIDEKGVWDIYGRITAEPY